MDALQSPARSSPHDDSLGSMAQGMTCRLTPVCFRIDVRGTLPAPWPQNRKPNATTRIDRHATQCSVERSTCRGHWYEFIFERAQHRRHGSPGPLEIIGPSSGAVICTVIRGRHQGPSLGLDQPIPQSRVTDESSREPMAVGGSARLRILDDDVENIHCPTDHRRSLTLRTERCRERRGRGCWRWRWRWRWRW